MRRLPEAVALVAFVGTLSCGHDRASRSEPKPTPQNRSGAETRIETQPGPNLARALATEPAPPIESFECAREGRGPANARTSKLGYIWPVDGVVVSHFGSREGERHDGIDIAAPSGTPIWAATAGRVVFAGKQPGYGLVVIVKHTEERVSIYAHNARNCVREGEVVELGDLVALVGQSGSATSPAVHFEIRLGTEKVNPRRFLP